MAQQLSLSIERRPGRGTAKSHALRRTGKVPGVVYGHGSSETIAVERRALDELLHHGGRTGLVELRLDGKKFDTALVREIQIDPVSRKAIHVDLQRVGANETVHAKLPITTAGTPDGVRNFAGVMDVIVHELDVEGPANKLPDHLEVDVTELGIHEHVTAGEVKLPDGFKLLTAPDTIVVTVESSKTARALEEADLGASIEQTQPELVGKPESEGAAGIRLLTPPETRIVAGLGNPGKEYERTRHNVGFLAVDEVAQRLSVGSWKAKDGARQAYDSQRKLVLVEPQTYMNNSGVPLRLIASWYRTPPESVLVVYDDMDLPFGKVRMRPFGGHGGHNGMRSIIATMTDRFPRIRIGLGRPQNDGIDHVLGTFSAEERLLLPKILDIAAQGVLTWLDDGTDAAMRLINTSEIA